MATKHRGGRLPEVPLDAVTPTREDQILEVYTGEEPPPWNDVF